MRALFGIGLVCCSLLILNGAFAQRQLDRINLFVDCDFCDHDYYRTELTFVNFVRDRADADVHALITQRYTASGGNEYTFSLIGRKNFAGMVDTLVLTTQESDTDDIIRREQLRVLKLGLMRYVAHSNVGREISIQHTLAETEQEDERKQVRDKWNYWVFSISANGNLNGESSYKSHFLFGNIDIRRVTEDLKVGVNFYGHYNEARYSYGDTKAMSFSRGHGTAIHAVFSLTSHWSAGGLFDAYRSTYSNRDISLQSIAAIEYNIFPYSESTRRELRIQYKLRHVYNDYVEETIYFKDSEHLGLHSLGAEAKVIQPWGSASISVYGSHYLHDFRRNRLQGNVYISVRVISGLSFNVNGYATRVRDLLSLPRGEASQEDVLLRRRQLDTNYTYWASIGFSYTFGSIYNNIVNPRFGE